MKKYLSIAILSIFLSLTLIGQNDKTLLVIENQKVPVSEFLDIYTKNNKNVDYSKASIDEYLDLFINYKLKLMEIQRLRLDTQKIIKMWTILKLALMNIWICLLITNSN